MFVNIKNFMKELGVFLGKKDAQGFPIRYNEYGDEIKVPALTNYDWKEVKEPITRKEAKAWVKNLRSGKFEQGRNALKDLVSVEHEGGPVTGTACFCCLGVLADARGDITIENSDYRFKGTETGYLRQCETEEFCVYTFYGMPMDLQREYADFNDELDYTFSMIANKVEEDFGL